MRRRRVDPSSSVETERHIWPAARAPPLRRALVWGTQRPRHAALRCLVERGDILRAKEIAMRDHDASVRRRFEKQLPAGQQPRLFE
ncbi:MAG: hypothetical protein ACRDQA_06780 [Nocardioidaceae bacterium]